jgi:hypothetical protein
VMSSAAGLWKLFRDQAERGSGIGLKLFGFIAESVFTIIPESCSGSPRNTVRNHPGIAFTFARIPQFMYNSCGQEKLEPCGCLSSTPDRIPGDSLAGIRRAARRPPSIPGLNRRLTHQFRTPIKLPLLPALLLRWHLQSPAR